MEKIFCPAGETHKIFKNGAIAFRAAAWMGPARGTLSEVISSESESGSYVRDTQTVSWSGVDHYDTSTYTEAGDTLVIDLTEIAWPEQWLYYWVYMTVRARGEAGNYDGKWGQKFWGYSEPIVNVYASQNDDFSVISALSDPIPRNQTQFTLDQMVGGVSGRVLLPLEETTETYHVRAFKRATSGGDIEIQIDQVIFLPGFGGAETTPSEYVAPTSQWFGIYSTFPYENEEVTTRSQLDDGIFTVDQSQPAGGGIANFDISEMQEGDDDITGVHSDHSPAVIGFDEPREANMSVAIGIVHSDPEVVEDDDFNRTDANDWSVSPYGYLWQPAHAFGISMNSAPFSVTPGVAQLGPIGSNDISFPALSCAVSFANGTSTIPPTEGYPGYEPRDTLQEIEWSLEELPETGAAINLGELGAKSGVESGWTNFLVARIYIQPDGTMELYFLRLWYSQSGSSPKPGPPAINDWLPGVSRETRATAWPGVVDGDSSAPLWHPVAANPISLGTYSPGDRWHLTFGRRGYNLYTKAWKDGESEPDWQIEDRVVVMYLDPDDTFATRSAEYPYDDVISVGIPHTHAVQYAWDKYGPPGVWAWVQPPQGNLAALNTLSFYVHQYRIEYWNTDEPATDTWLKVTENVGESGSPYGPFFDGEDIDEALNLGTKSQHWVRVASRLWSGEDGYNIHQWSDPGSSVLQWCVSGLTHYRRFVRKPVHLHIRYRTEEDGGL